MKYFTIIALICSVSFLSALNMSAELPEIYEDGAEFALRINQGFDDTESAKFLFRAAEEESYILLEMDRGFAADPLYTVVIPKKYHFTSAVEFYFEVKLTSGEVVTYPENNPQINPQRIVVAPSNALSESIVLLSPDVNFPVDGDELIIAFSYFAIQNEIRTNSIKIMLNGKDYTSRATVTKNMAVLKIPAPEAGSHSFSLVAESVMGKKISSEQFNFDQGKGKSFIPFSIDGSASVHGNYKSKTEMDNRKEANLRLLLNGRRNWFNFKTKMYLSSREDSNKQTVNRFRIDLNVPHFGVKIGDYSPNFGSFTANSVNIRGVFSELNFKKFRVQAIYGDSKRAILGDLYTVIDTSYSDTNNSVVDTLYSNRNIAYRRSTLGLRTEFGHKRYFNFAFSIIKNKDQIDSLEEEDYFAPDSTLLVRPKDNIVISTDTRFAFKDQRIVFGAEAAMSLYNSNTIDGSISQDSLETLAGQEIPMNPADYEDIFVINANLEPFIPGVSNLSYKAYMRVFLFRNLLNVSYTYVGGSFNNLAVGYLSKDLATISVSDNLNLFKNRLLLNLTYNINSNNLAADKEYTTNNSTIFAQVYARPTASSFLNFSYNNNVSDISTGDFETGSEVMTMGAGYNVEQINFAPTRFSVSFSNSVSSDLINDSYNLNKNIVTLSANSKYRDWPLKSSIGYSISMDDNQYESTDNSEYSYHSFFAKSSYILAEKFEPLANLRISVASGDFEYTSQMLNLGTKYKFDKLTELYGAVGFSNYTYEAIPENDTSEMELTFNLKRRF